MDVFMGTVEFPLSFWLPKGSDEAFRFFQPQIWPLPTFYSQEIDGFVGISPATRGIGVNLSGICVELTWLDQQDFPGFFCTEVSMVSINRYQQLWKHLTVSSKIPAVGQVKKCTGHCLWTLWKYQLRCPLLLQTHRLAQGGWPFFHHKTSEVKMGRFSSWIAPFQMISCTQLVSLLSAISTRKVIFQKQVPMRNYAKHHGKRWMDHQESTFQSQSFRRFKRPQLGYPATPPKFQHSTGGSLRGTWFGRPFEEAMVSWTDQVTKHWRA